LIYILMIKTRAKENYTLKKPFKENPIFYYFERKMLNPILSDLINIIHK